MAYIGWWPQPSSPDVKYQLNPDTLYSREAPCGARTCVFVMLPSLLLLLLPLEKIMHVVIK